MPLIQTLKIGVLVRIEAVGFPAKIPTGRRGPTQYDAIFIDGTPGSADWGGLTKDLYDDGGLRCGITIDFATKPANGQATVEVWQRGGATMDDIGDDESQRDQKAI